MRVTRGEMFRRVPTLKPGRSVFDLSYSKKMSGKMGYLYPMMCDEVVPGDMFKIGADAVIRFAPMVAPVLHEIVLKADWFFVPYRILYNTSADVDGNTLWERFITGGQNGDDVTTRGDLYLLDMKNKTVTEGGLWDHLGIPPGINLASATGDDAPLLFPGLAYQMIWNEYYRDPNLEDPKELSPAGLLADAPCYYANWDADYFTRAFGDQQRGTMPALPVSGLTFAEWHDADFADVNASSPSPPHFELAGAGGSDPVMRFGPSAYPNPVANAKAFFNANEVDLSGATSVNIADLRLAVQLQKWMERNQRSGYRYTEFLQAHFGVAPRDDRLDRPEYIGGVRQNVIISEVLQTSETTENSNQGTMAGHGICAGSHYVGKYHVKEYGLIMCIMSITPRPAYQQGINRQWLRQTRYDFYHPEFANLSEQAILNEEIYLGTVEATNTGTFGYQGRYDEMRVKHDMVAGAFRDSLDFWHLGRQFGSLPALNTSFGHTDPSTLTRIFADTESDNIYVHWGNRLTAIRPLPLQSNPGLMDHSYGGI